MPPGHSETTDRSARRANITGGEDSRVRSRRRCGHRRRTWWSRRPLPGDRRRSRDDHHARSRDRERRAQEGRSRQQKRERAGDLGADYQPGTEHGEGVSISRRGSMPVVYLLLNRTPTLPPIPGSGNPMKCSYSSSVRFSTRTLSCQRSMNSQVAARWNTV